MACTIDLGTDDGYTEVCFAGLEKPLRLDVYEECEALNALLERTSAEGESFAAAVRERLVKAHGFPDTISTAVADRYAVRLYERSRELREGLKKTEPGSAGHS